MIRQFFARGAPTPVAQDNHARDMWRRGEDFILAGQLLRQSDRDGYVAIHLFCQGVECLLKALLLRYGSTEDQLKAIGHNLEQAATEVERRAGVRVFRGNAVMTELAPLNRFYMAHRLKYSHVLSFFVHPSTIPYGRVLKRITALIRVSKRPAGHFGPCSTQQ